VRRPAEVQLGADVQRLGDLGAQHLGQRAARGAPRQLAHDEPEGQGVVAGHRPWCPPGALLGDERADAPCITQVCGGDLRPQPGHPGGVDEHVSERHHVLAVRAELWPHIRHALVIGQLAASGEHVHRR
jgi:hypothetical protein